MHRADDWLLGAEQADRLLVEMPAGAAARRLLHRPGIRSLREIGAGAERAALRRQHDRAAGRVGVEPLEGFANLGDQQAVKKIMRRPAHLDRRHDAVEADADFLEPAVIGHLGLLLEPRKHQEHEILVVIARRAATKQSPSD